MTQAPTELSQTLVSIESIKIYLAGLVAAASDNRGGAPVRLTYVGGEFAKTVGMPFEQHVSALADSGQLTVPRTCRKLAPFVRAYCEDIFAVSEDPAGVYFVAPLGPGGEGAPRAAPPRLAPMLRFHRAIWAAFIRPLDGKRRFLNLDKIGFTDAAEPPADGNWREIEERFVLGLAPGAAIDGAVLQSRIEEWSRETGVALSRLVIGARPSKAPGRQLDQLLEIIDALPAALAASWHIPAAVLKHLRDAR